MSPSEISKKDTLLQSKKAAISVESRKEKKQKVEEAKKKEEKKDKALKQNKEGGPLSFLSFNFILRCPTFWDRIFSSTVQVQIYFHPTHPVNQEYRRPTIDLTYFNPDSRIHAISICSLRQKPVTFKYLSPKLLGTHSTFLLYTLESSTPIRITTPGLDWRDEAEDKSRILYSSEIIPEFWENIAKSDDPTKYVLVQIFQTYSARLGRKNHDIPVIYRFAKTPVSQYVKDVFPVVKPPKPSVSSPLLIPQIGKFDIFDQWMPAM